MMKNRRVTIGQSLARLFRFLFWYGAAVALLFYLLPIAGVFLEGQYEAMSGLAKFVSVLGFFTVFAAWQVLSQRDRLRASFRGD
jgi:hypothetical protein